MRRPRWYGEAAAAGAGPRDRRWRATSGRQAFAPGWGHPRGPPYKEEGSPYPNEYRKSTVPQSRIKADRAAIARPNKPSDIGRHGAPDPDFLRHQSLQREVPYLFLLAGAESRRGSELRRDRPPERHDAPLPRAVALGRRAD